MKKQITLKGWANCTNYIFCENSGNHLFLSNFEKVKNELLHAGYNELKFGDNLRGKNVKDKITIYAHYWCGAWADPTTEKYAIFYR